MGLSRISSGLSLTLLKFWCIKRWARRSPAAIQPESEQSGNGPLLRAECAMDDVTKTSTAAAVYRYLEARSWYNGTKLPRTPAGPRVTPEALAQDLGQGRRLLADGVLVYPA